MQIKQNPIMYKINFNLIIKMVKKNYTILNLEKNWYASVKWYSYLVFNWILPILKEGLNNPIKVENLYSLPR